MGIILSSVVLSAIISGFVTGGGYWLSYQNTGKKLESYKKLLEAKGSSFDETIKLYKIINVITIDLNHNELNSPISAIKALENLTSKYNMNEIFIPEKVAKTMKKFIEDFEKYIVSLESYNDAKQQDIRETTSEHQERLDGAIEKIDESCRKLSDDFTDLRKEIKTKFTMFD